MIRDNIDLLILIDGHHEADELMALTGASDIDMALQELAAGIVTNPLWQELSCARLVARGGPFPLLGVFGNFNAFEHDRLHDLAIRIGSMLARHRYLDYQSAECVAKRLAVLLEARYGREAISEFYFTAIPRGGLIVLGMLSYLLDLRPDQLILSTPLNVPSGKALVIIDDCALSGVRFQQFLDQIEADRIIFCPLLAVPKLGQAIERSEPRVEAVIHAEDLEDTSNAHLGEHYADWCEQHWRRMVGHGYRVGFTEHVAFAWCEPQSRYWNSLTQRMEASWNLLSPGRCLKRQALAAKLDRTYGESCRLEPVFLVSEGHGPLVTSDGVLWVDLGSELALARMADGEPQESESSEDHGAILPCFRLEGVAADMWRCVLEHGNLDDAEAALLQRYDVDPLNLRADLVAFVADLEDKGLLINCQSRAVSPAKESWRS